MTPADTIVAVASPAGRGAVGVIRVSGGAVPAIAAVLLGVLPPPRTAVLHNFRAADGGVLDRGLALYFQGPASFTGEDVLELQGHGGAWVLDGILQRILGLGARLARPGEFSERAFLNGKLDLTQAEAVADLIDAGTAAAARAAVRSLQGEFSSRIRDLQSQLTGLRVTVEAGIDFPDEDLDLKSGPGGERLAALSVTFDSITAACRQGTLLRDGFCVVIAGQPNAGKSSLLNRLVGDDIAIVTPLPGTTRDLLRHQIQLGGMPVNLVDTAGLRAAADAVEAEGIRRARAEMQRADHILWVVDATVAEEMPDPRECGDVPVTVVINKVDLPGARSNPAESTGAASIGTATVQPPRLYVSARTGEGLDALRHHLLASAGFRETDGGTLSARRRHLEALRQARAALDQAVLTLEHTGAVELFAEDLRVAQNALSGITGELSSDDLLGDIFSSFCIGK